MRRTQDVLRRSRPSPMWKSSKTSHTLRPDPTVMEPIEHAPLACSCRARAIGVDGAVRDWGFAADQLRGHCVGNARRPARQPGAEWSSSGVRSLEGGTRHGGHQ